MNDPKLPEVTKTLKQIKQIFAYALGITKYIAVASNDKIRKHWSKSVSTKIENVSQPNNYCFNLVLIKD